MKFTESTVEEATLEWFQELGYDYRPGPEIAHDGLFAERKGYEDIVLQARLRSALERLNPRLPATAVDDALKQVTRPAFPTLILNNRAFHKMLTDGVDVRYRRKDLPAPRPGLFFVYAIRCGDSSIYIGQTEDLENRWNQHKSGTGAEHTRKYGALELVHYEEYPTREEAVAREKWLKTGFGREWLRREIAAGRARQAGGRVATEKAWLFDFKTPDNNDWLVVNQFTVVENNVQRRPDVVVFVNGVPLAVIELKNAADEDATVAQAYNQLQTYKAQTPSLFTYNAALVISDGIEARVGTITANQERFNLWRTIDGKKLAPVTQALGEVLVKGLFHKDRFLEWARSFVTFEDDGNQVAKKAAAYHQFHAVKVAVAETLRASKAGGDRRIGVVWHTQGSGKSLTMLFFAGQVIAAPEMENPTLVVLTDRNDLDNQLFTTFSRGQDLIRQAPVQAESRAHLRELLSVKGGGVVFTTIQKFFPAAPRNREGERPREPKLSGRPGEIRAREDALPPDAGGMPLLSDRRNIVVIADEAHRSQYEFIHGFAKHMRDALPGASFIGFTGTPIEKGDKSTTAVFGEHISVYDIQQAIDDGVTVRIYYESRLAKIDLDAAERPRIDPEFEEITETEEAGEKNRLARKWSRLEAMVGTDRRLGLIARDIVDHFEKRLEVMDGKAMIVCMSRRICVDLYDKIIALRPHWDSQDFGKGALKVVMTGSAADPERYKRHLMTGQAKKLVENRFKDPKDSLKVVIVRDMWLTGFDVPCLHTMYIDKPSQGHSLMQAIARVNRVFHDKPGGLVVDYLGLTEELKEAIKTYTRSGGNGKPAFNQEEAIRLMLEKHEILCGIFSGFDWSGFIKGSPSRKLNVLKEAVEFILGTEDGAERVLTTARQLMAAFALSVPSPEAMKIRDDVGFFQAVRAQLAKIRGGPDGTTDRDLDAAIKQLVSKSVATNEVIDVFKQAGLDKPEVSVLDDAFLDQFKDMPQKNLAVEMLRRLLSDEIRKQAKKNLVMSRSFAQLLEEAIHKYQNRTLEAAAIIAELVKMAKDLKASMKRGDKLGLNEAEMAFYDALGTNDSAVAELGDATLKAIARDLVKGVRKSVTIDWTIKEAVRAKIRAMVKRILRNYDYPPDKQEQATHTVLAQAELLCADWAG